MQNHGMAQHGSRNILSTALCFVENILWAASLQLDKGQGLFWKLRATHGARDTAQEKHLIPNCRSFRCGLGVNL